MHTVAVVANHRLRHERRRLAVGMGNIHDRIFHDLHFVGFFHQRIEFNTYFALTGGRDLVVVHLRFNAHILHRQTHRRAQVLQRIDWRNRKIPALDARAMAEITILIGLFRIPAGLAGVDFVKRAGHLHAPAHIVKNKEFVLRPKKRLVRDAGRFEVDLRALRQRSRVALVALHGIRFDNIATQIDGRIFTKNIHDRRVRVRHQDHVGLVDALPAVYRGAIEHFPVFKKIVVNRVRR